MRSLLLLTACLSGLLLTFTARGNTFAVTGVVRVPIDATGHITIAHEDIPDLMPAMTMSFTVVDPATVVSLKAGDRVHFKLNTDGADWTVSGLTVVGHETPPRPAHQNISTGRRLREGDHLPDFSCITEDGQPITAALLKGKVTLLTFIFTRCPVPAYCPAMALRFAQLQKAIGASAQFSGHVRLLSITLDPEYDRPEILKKYGQAVGADPAVWQFATGTEEQIAELTKSFAVFTERNGVTLDHTLCTALIDPDGRILQLWRGNGWKVDEVLNAFATAIPTSS